MSRPTPFTSAFATNADWFAMSDWPASATEAMAGMTEAESAKAEIGKLEGKLASKWKTQQKAAKARQAKAKKAAAPRRQLTEPAPLEEAKLQPSIPDRYTRMKTLSPLLAAATPHHASNGTQAVSPNTPNAQQAPPRYFRALVWNLENFTADKRPKGTEAVDSARNMARVATVGSLACRLGADAALIMETGSDIGAVATRLADYWNRCEVQLKDGTQRPVHPLATSATHAMPELPWDVAPATYPAEPDAVNALRLLGEGYRIKATALPVLQHSSLQPIRDLLLRTANSFRLADVPLPPVTADFTTTVRSWIDWCYDIDRRYDLFSDADELADELADDTDEETEDEEFLDDEDSDIADDPSSHNEEMGEGDRYDMDEEPVGQSTEGEVSNDDSITEEGDDETMQTISELDLPEDDQGDADYADEGEEDIDIDDDEPEEAADASMWRALDRLQNDRVLKDSDAVRALCEGAVYAGELAATYGASSLDSAVAQAAQLIMLVCLLDCQGEQKTIVKEYPGLWENGEGSPADMVLVVLLLAVGQQLELHAHDDDNGPLMTATDGELLLNAFFRLGVLKKPNSETYCVAYRPQTDAQRDLFFGVPACELGYATKGIYGILRGASAKELLATQQPANALAGRAGLLIQFPTVGAQWISFLLHHNRYSGNQATDNLRMDHTKSENTVIARLRTIEDELAFLAGYAPQTLLVGDFNLPTDYVHLSGATGVPAMRRDRLVHDHRLKVAMAGYLRRRAADDSVRRTTLRVPKNIAKGADIFSEPYDAVYQPFDFQDGAARVRSATIVRAAAFFDKASLLQAVTYAGTHGQVTGTLGGMVCDSIVGLYRGLVKSIYYAIRDSAGWLAALKEDPGKDTGIQYAQAELVSHAKDHTDGLAQRAMAFDKLLRTATGSDAFYAAIIVDGTAQKASTTANLDALKKAVANVKDHVVIPKNPRGQKRPPKPGPVRLLEVPELIAALQNLEAHSDRRLWCAYHALVSDHLPLLVEIDLQG
jgi:hypothetical protein